MTETLTSVLHNCPQCAVDEYGTLDLSTGIWTCHCCKTPLKIGEAVVADDVNLERVDPHDPDECRDGMNHLRGERDRARDLAQRLEEELSQVWEIHQPTWQGTQQVCAEDGSPMPCPTRRAIDGANT